MIEAMSIANALTHPKAMAYVRNSPSPVHLSFKQSIDTTLEDTIPREELTEGGRNRRKSFFVTPGPFASSVCFPPLKVSDVHFRSKMMTKFP